MKTLTIDRSKWRTGGDNTESENSTGAGYTHLLNGFGYMCCLGFYCSQSGISDKKLLGSVDPRDVFYGSEVKENPIPLLMEIGKNSGANEPYNTRFTDDAIDINDNPELTTRERESKITEHFARFGVEVVFVGEYESKEVINEKYGIVKKAMVN